MANIFQRLANVEHKITPRKDSHISSECAQNFILNLTTQLFQDEIRCWSVKLLEDFVPQSWLWLC